MTAPCTEQHSTEPDSSTLKVPLNSSLLNCLRGARLISGNQTLAYLPTGQMHHKQAYTGSPHYAALRVFAICSGAPFRSKGKNVTKLISRKSLLWQAVITVNNCWCCTQAPLWVRLLPVILELGSALETFSPLQSRKLAIDIRGVGGFFSC